MLDITFDLETCALCPTAAVMSIGAVAWNRDGEKTPFFTNELELPFPTFEAHVDLRGMFMDGFAFDAKTAQWWNERSDAARAAVLAADCDEMPCRPIQEVIKDFFDWIDYVCKTLQEKEVNLWCQGTDFDMAILRNICKEYEIDIPISHRNFRDHRTYYMESAAEICRRTGVVFDPENAYSLVEPYTLDGFDHDPLYDCNKSINATWQMMHHQHCLSPAKND